MKTNSAIAFSLLAVMFGLLAVRVSAEPFDPEIKLTAANASAKAWIGQALAIDGNIAILGSDHDNDLGLFSGAAYLFDVTTGSELFKLTASDGKALAAFGHSVVIDGNTALVGAYSDDDEVIGEDTGAAYLFDVTTGEELFKLTASDKASGDQFGHGIGISGNRAVIGSHLNDDNGASSGSAYVFDVTTGEELMTLTASDGTRGDQFGYWTAISGNIAIVGAKFDSDTYTRAGAAYLFDVTTGEELFKLTASDIGLGAQFGYAVAIEGNTAVVGAQKDNEGGFQSGAVYVFDVTTGEEVMKITASDAAPMDYFGYALGISDNTLVVGAYGDNDAGGDSGSLYLYDLTFGDELGKVTASDAEAGDEFGTAVGISGNVAISGALFKDTTSGTDVGQGYAYDISAILPPGADFNDDGIVDEADLLVWDSFNLPRLDVDGNDQVDGSDFLEWQRSLQTEILIDESPANLDQQGPVDEVDLSIWEQSFGADGLGDTNEDGDSDGGDFLAWQRGITPFDPADKNRDRRVDGFDLELWNTSFGWDGDTNSDGILDADANGDGIVNKIDFQWWQKHFTGGTSVAAPTQVPEPSSYMLLSGLLAASLFIRHRRRGF